MWGAIILFALLAFLLLPIHERFESKQGPGNIPSNIKSDGTKAGSGVGPGAMYDFSSPPAVAGAKADTTPDEAPNAWTAATPADNYIAKSALVPCTCTTHSMGCAKHGGGKDSSKAPGDLDGATPSQYGVMKPFSSYFTRQEEPSGFLNTINAFMH